jgi:hypothetical protein
MSKASEWATTRKKGERSPSFRVHCTRLSIALPTKRIGVRVKVESEGHWRKHLIGRKHAIRMANWILDTFDEQK